MGKWEKVSKKRLGFTIVELLTVMSVIAILIGLLVPALNLVRDYAKELQQSAQFHSIEVAIDMFVAQSGYGNYPPSKDNIPASGAGTTIDIAPYGGAQKLAEALVGWDLLGYHPLSSFRSDGCDDLGNLIYDTAGVNLIPNIEQRKEQFIELENANAYMLGDIYSDLTGSAVSAFNPDNYVLCDVYAKKRTLAVNQLGKKTGMPILYYKARTRWYAQDHTNTRDMGVVPQIPGTIEDDIYYYPDNENLLLLGDPDDPLIEQPLAIGGAGNVANLLLFETIILNDEVTALNRPYRAGSFILISAGKDGLYGTSDDLMNFKKER